MIKKKFNFNKFNFNKFNFNKFNFNKLNFNKFKKFISKRSSITAKKNKKSFFNSDYRSLYLTTISSLGVILFFFFLPFIFELLITRITEKLSNTTIGWD